MDRRHSSGEVARLSFAADFVSLLRRKVIVDEMTVEGVRFGTPRTRSGALVSQTPKVDEAILDEESSEGSSPLTLPTFEAPDVTTIMAEENLDTLRLIETMQADLQLEGERWEQRIKELPGRETFAKYEARIKKLKGATNTGLGGILGGIGELRSIREEIEDDIANIKDAKKEFVAALASMRGRLKEVLNAPQADVRRLQQKYSLSPQGLANLSGPLFGQAIGAWVSQTVVWYGRLKPVLQRAQEVGVGNTGPEVAKPIRGGGVDVRFKETHPLPEFLVRRAEVSLQLEVGDLAGRIENITPEQDVLGKPLVFEFAGEKLTGVRSVSLKGSLNHINPTEPHTRITLEALGYRIQEVSLSKQAAWPMALKKGLADVRLQAGLRGEALTVNLNSDLRYLTITAGKANDSNPLTVAMSSAVSGLSGLSIQADVKGTRDDYDVKVTSNLDRVLKRAAGSMVRDLSSRFQKELTGAVSHRVRRPLKELQSGFTGLKSINGDLTRRLSRSNQLLRSSLKGSVSTEGFPGGLKLPF